MVLEDISSSSSPDLFANDNVSPSDGNVSPQPANSFRLFAGTSNRPVTDGSAHVTSAALHLQYRVNGGQLRRYQLPFDRMPVQGITRTAAFGSPLTTARTSNSLVGAMASMESVSGRPLTQSEAEALALHVSRTQVYSAIAQYGGILAGCGWAFYKRKTFKFPLRKPKPIESYNAFPLQRAPLLTGQYARGAWHVTRGIVYMGLSLLVLAPICGQLSKTSEVVHMLKDERMKGLTKEIIVSLQNSLRESKLDPTRTMGQSARNLKGEGAGQVSAAWNQLPSEPSAYGEEYGGSKDGYVQDDNSPTSSQYPYSDTYSNAGTASELQMPSRSRSQRAPPAFQDPSSDPTFDLEKEDRQPRPFEPQPTPTKSSSSPFFTDDDNDNTSPTTSNQPYPNPPATPPGSAWARIRQFANSNTRPSPTPSPSQPAPVTDPTNKRGITPPHMRTQSASARHLQQKSTSDEYAPGSAESNNDNSFSFNNDDSQERQWTKEQAQRDFDHMLEAERRGEDGGAAAAGAGGGESAWSKRRRSS